MSEKEQFGSRWGLVLATLGMAVGTGNIWRFPRIVASNGGGSFLIAWAVFLILWSIPLMIVEFSFGKKARLGTVGAFRKLVGPNAGWMGGWVAFCAAAIMFYYSVVAGWCLRYLAAAMTNQLRSDQAETFWNGYAGTGAAWVTHALALSLAVGVVWFGVRGIERVAKILIPTLFVLVVVLAIRAVTLPGAVAGLEFLFKPDWSALGNVRIWLQALTQNAWDTGAGWGLILTYAIYMKAREDVPLNAFLIGFGNNSVSLLAGIMVLCTVFAINPGARDEIVGAGNEGLTFIWMPQLFDQMPGGRFFMVIFFLALSFAALTSLISMVELVARILMDAGLERRKAVLVVALVGLALGTPSALSLAFFHNQDWVWGVGLMLSGLFYALGARKFGVERLRTEVVNGEGCDMPIGRWWSFLVAVVVPVEAVILMLWWLWEARGWNPQSWLNPFLPESVGTVLVQWTIALVALVLLQRWLGRRSSTVGDRQS
jgi:NSS family neurotransmitter:Na+ symporter